MRKRIYEIIEPGNRGDWASAAYDILMLVAIAASIVPLMFVEETKAFIIIEQITVLIFIIDYILRWITADYRIKKGAWSFVLYPITGWAIIDLLSILPGLQLLGKGFKILRITRLLRTLRLLKFIRYSDKVLVLGTVIRKEKKVLFTVLVIAIFYVFLTALIMFNAEPRLNPVTGAVTFQDFFDALYWATVTLTTVGYGDMIPVTDIGRFVSMLSSLFGVAIIALPSGVITASYLEELRSLKDKENQTEDPSLSE
jgi:voltage-gated potassium channel